MPTRISNSFEISIQYRREMNMDNNLLQMHYNADPRQDDQKGDKSTDDAMNGLVFNGIMLPEEIITQILSHVEIKSVLMCRLVCIKWNEFFKSKHFWSVRLNRIDKTTRNYLPWYVFYAVEVGNVFDRNLLKNTHGQEKMKHWKVRRNGGDGWAIENTPQGALPLPELPEFKEQQGCFATSFQVCSKSQFIRLVKDSLLHRIIREFHPIIEASEWFAGRFDCGCKYKLSVKFFDHYHQPIFTSVLTRTVEQWTDSKWAQAKMNCEYDENTAKKISYIELYHEGSDTQFWKGHYGSKMAGASIQLLYDSL